VDDRDNMKIKTQIRISLIIFVIMAVGIFFSVYSGYIQLQEIQKKQQILDRIEQSSSELYYLENDYIIHGGTIPVIRWNTEYIELTGYLQALTLTDLSQQAVLNQMLISQNELNKSFSNMVAVTSGEQGTGPGGVSQELKEFSASTLEAQTQMLMSRTSELSQLVKTEAYAVEQRTILIISFSIAVLMLFVLLNFLIINRSVLKSISALQNGAERIGSGDLDTSIETISNNELGYLSQTFNKMASSLANSRNLLLTTNIDLEEEITERKRAEEMLRERDSQIRALIDNLPFDTWAMDSSGKYILQNPVSVGLWGDFIGKTTPRIPVPAYLIKHWLDNNREVLNGKSVRGELTVSFEGEKRIFDEIVAPVRIGNEIKGIIGVNIDITERKNAEEVLAKSEEMFRTLLERVPSIAVQGYGADHIVVYWNEANTRMYGYTAEEAIGRDIRDLVVPAPARDEVTKAIARMAETGIPEPSAELELRHKNGSNVPVFSSHAVVKIPGRSTIQFCFDVDLSERKKAENAIRESEEKFRGIFDHINDGLHIHEVEPDGKPGKFIEVNEIACKMLQYTREEMMEHSPLDFATDYHSKPLDQIFLENSTTGHTIFETGHRRKDGTIIPVEINTHVVNLQGKRVIVAAVRDITDRKTVENTLVRVNQKLNVLSQLTRNDLTNQIFVLSSYLELAKHQLAGQERITEIVQKGVHTIRLINETIEYSKDFQDMGAKPPKWQNMKLVLLMGLSHISIGNIQHSIETENLEIFADPLLEKVCQRLFTNSVKHGGHVTRIRVWHNLNSDKATIFFEDDGIGITQERKDQIFLRNEGAYTSMRSLVFVREILDITDITIKETGEPGKGARFEMTVPKRMWKMTGKSA